MQRTTSARNVNHVEEISWRAPKISRESLYAIPLRSPVVAPLVVCNGSSEGTGRIDGAAVDGDHDQVGCDRIGDEEAGRGGGGVRDELCLFITLHTIPCQKCSHPVSVLLDISPSLRPEAAHITTRGIKIA